MLSAFVLVSCVEDAELGEKDSVNSVVTAKVNEQSVLLHTNIGGFNIQDEVTERGFVITRMDNDSEWEMEETIKLPLDGPFESTVDNDLWRGLQCKAYAYVIAGRKKFRTATIDFRPQMGAKPIIKSVKITNQEGINGTIEIEGDHLGRNSHNISLEVVENVLGKVICNPRTCTTNKIYFTFACCNIGTFTLRLNVNGYSTVLDQKITVDCAHLNNFNPNPVFGMPTPIDITVDNGRKNSVNCVLDHTLKLTSSNKLLADGSWTTVFTGKGKKHTASVSYNDGLYDIYFPDQEVNYTYAWKQVATLKSDITPQTFAAGRAWQFYGDITDPWGGVRLLGLDPETGEVKKYKYPKTNLTINGHSGNFKAFGVGNVVYCLASYYTGDCWDGGYAYTRLLEFNPATEEWKDLVDIPAKHQIDSDTYRSFAKVGNTFYFASITGQTAVWNSVTNELTLDESVDMTAYYDEFCGYDDSNFYYHWNAIEAISFLDFRTKKVVVPNRFDVHYKFPYEHYYSCNSFVHNGFLYHGCLGSAQNLSDMKDVRYYGLPNLDDASPRSFMPIGDNVYILMDNGVIYKHQ